MVDYFLIQQSIERSYAQLDEQELINLVSFLENLDDFRTDSNLIMLRNIAQSYIDEIYIRYII